MGVVMKYRLLALACVSAAACGDVDPPRLGASLDFDAGRDETDSGAPDVGRPPAMDAGVPRQDAGSLDTGGALDSGAPEGCAVRAEPGPCQAAIPRFTYDPALGRCVAFIWGGCGDNPNNYQDMFECTTACEPDAVYCGGFGGPTCEANEFCDYPDSLCGAADGPGICRARPDGCNTDWNPVCGCDGQTYSNECSAYVSGVDLESRGPC